MAKGSGIEWTESTWNPVTGCTKVSPGCRYCYAERISKRLQAMGQLNYRRGFRLAFHEHMLEVPLRWKKPQIIFVNSMSDLFHEKVPLEYIARIFEIMGKARWHIFQVLTKRSERLASLDQYLTWHPNIWMGVSVENKDFTFRIDNLKKTGARIKFISLEPLLGPVPGLDLGGIDWVIVGGESGPNARPLEQSWVANVRDQCLRSSVPFFFKQWGGANKKKAGRTLDGTKWSQMPAKSCYHASQFILPISKSDVISMINAESSKSKVAVDVTRPAKTRESG